MRPRALPWAILPGPVGAEIQSAIVRFIPRYGEVVITYSLYKGLQMKLEPCIIDCHTHVGVDYANYLENAHPYAMSFEDLVARLERHDVGRALVFPFGSSYHLPAEGAPATLRSHYPYERENLLLLREINEIYPELAERAFPFAMFDPSVRVEEQVAGLEALCGQYRLYGLKTCSTYLRAFLKDLHGKGRPLLDFAARRQLPILLHVSYDPGDPWAPLADALDVVEANPGLRFCLAHTARFCAAALERANRLPNCFVDFSAFKIHCDLAVANHPAVPPPAERVDADYGHPQTALRQIAEAFPDTMMWGTDAPYYSYIKKFTDARGVTEDERLRSSYGAECAILNALPRPLIQKIAFDNTVQFLFGDASERPT